MMVESGRAAWATIRELSKNSATAPWRGLALGTKDELGKVKVSEFGACAKMFVEFTGRGCEDFHPRWLGCLSEGLLDFLMVLLQGLERKGFWPSQVSEISIAQIPKSDGGRRPIRLLPVVWERVRQPVVAAWRLQVCRPYNWAAKGRGFEAAVWRTAVETEAAVARAEDSAATLLDLVKAYEMVKLELVWWARLRLGSPVRMLRLVLETSAFLRTLKLGNAYAEGISTLSAILAGEGVGGGRSGLPFPCFS